MFFGLFKRKPLEPIPLIEDDAIQPVGEPVSTDTAKQMFRNALTQLSGQMKLSREDISNKAKDFADRMREHPADLADDIAATKDDIIEEERNLKAKRRELETIAGGKERESLLEDIEEIEENIKEYIDQIDKTKEERKNFKKDKRVFLRHSLNYIIMTNNEEHCGVRYRHYDWEEAGMEI